MIMNGTRTGIATPEARKKMSITATENWKDPVYRKKVIAAMKEYWNDPKVKAEAAKRAKEMGFGEGDSPFNRSKPVNQYTKDGEFVMWHPSASSAARAVGVAPANVIMHCRGGKYRKTVKGFVFKYVENDDKIKDNLKKQR